MIQEEWEKKPLLPGIARDTLAYLDTPDGQKKIIQQLKIIAAWDIKKGTSLATDLLRTIHAESRPHDKTYAEKAFKEQEFIPNI